MPVNDHEPDATLDVMALKIEETAGRALVNQQPPAAFRWRNPPLTLPFTNGTIIRHLRLVHLALKLTNFRRMLLFERPTLLLQGRLFLGEDFPLGLLTLLYGCQRTLHLIKSSPIRSRRGLLLWR
jgi:hypothetical protein